MRLINDLLESVRDFDCPVKRVCVGLHWTVVQSRFTGMAHTYKSGDHHELESAGDFIGESAYELAQRLESTDKLEASLGLAALNSMINASGRSGNIFEDIFRMVEGKNITVIGRFPLNDQIAKIADKSYFLEMEPEASELPADACVEVIPKSDIVVITATALINKTMPRLLELSTAAKAKTFVLGPSTPMNEVLFSQGADYLGGVRVVDTKALINGIMQGMKKFKTLPGIKAVMRP
ncbi:MAG: DUF364 domain-containing protein [FCB group bacterium]|nr:DUF364 domain-containing protein [FCB group bacterium]